MSAPSYLLAGDPVTLFDGRRCELVSAPQFAGGSIGWWADVHEVLNACEDPFPGPEYGPVERVSLEGATDPLAKLRRSGCPHAPRLAEITGEQHGPS